MNDVSSAAAMFFTLCQIVKLMDTAHEKNCEWNSVISPGDSPDGYDIRIVIGSPGSKKRQINDRQIESLMRLILDALKECPREKLLAIKERLEAVK